MNPEPRSQPIDSSDIAVRRFLRPLLLVALALYLLLGPLLRADTLPPPPRTTVQAAAELEALARRIEEAKHPLPLDALFALEDALPYVAGPLDARLLAELFYLQSIVLWESGHDERALERLGFALTLRPDLEWNTRLKQSNRLRALAVQYVQLRRARLAEQSRASLTVEHPVRARRTYVDGLLVSTDAELPLELVPGLHLFQVDGGERWTGLWLTLDPGESRSLSARDLRSLPFESAARAPALQAPYRLHRLHLHSGVHALLAPFGASGSGERAIGSLGLDGRIPLSEVSFVQLSADWLLPANALGPAPETLDHPAEGYTDLLIQRNASPWGGFSAGLGLGSSFPKTGRLVPGVAIGALAIWHVGPFASMSRSDSSVAIGGLKAVLGTLRSGVEWTVFPRFPMVGVLGLSAQLGTGLGAIQGADGRSYTAPVLQLGLSGSLSAF